MSTEEQIFLSSLLRDQSTPSAARESAEQAITSEVERLRIVAQRGLDAARAEDKVSPASAA